MANTRGQGTKPIATKKAGEISTPVDDRRETIMEIVAEQVALIKSEFSQVLKAQDAKIDSLEAEIAILRKKMTKLDERVDDVGVHDRRNTVLVSGDGIPVARSGESCSNVVLDAVKTHLKLNIEPKSVESAYRVGAKPVNQSSDRRRIIVKLSNSEVKRDLMRACREQKPSIYINEDLTAQRSTILFVLRKVKRQFPNLISGCSSMDGKVYAWVKPPNAVAPNARNIRTVINTHEALKDFCSKVVNSSLDNFLSVWPH